MRILITGNGNLACAIADYFAGQSILMIDNETMKCDIGEVLDIIDKDIKYNGEYDYVINNFAINHLSWIGATMPDDSEIMRLNVLAPYWIINHLVGIGHKPCRVVNVASQTYRVAQRCTTLYCASKAALVMMTKVMARELAPVGWIINAIAPGKILGTQMSALTDKQVLQLRHWTEEDADKYSLSNIPAGRFTNPQEVAEAIAGLLKMPDYINGTCVDMTGGV